MRVAINSIFATFNTLSNAYSSLLASSNSVNVIIDSIENTRQDIVRAAESICKQATSDSLETRALSYAEAVSRVNAHRIPEGSTEKSACVAAGRFLSFLPTAS